MEESELMEVVFTNIQSKAAGNILPGGEKNATEAPRNRKKIIILLKLIAYYYYSENAWAY